jgi:hypothetical protein
MRNDARPIGEDAHDQSPVASHDPAVASQSPSDRRDSVAHDRQSHIVSQDAEEDAAHDQTMPTCDSTLNTKI